MAAEGQDLTELGLRSDYRALSNGVYWHCISRMEIMEGIQAFT